MNRIVEVGSHVVAQTLLHLAVAGRRGAEGVVLWLAQPRGDRLVVREAFVPDYESASDFFRIPPAGMTRLMSHLRANSLLVAAQVHSHPAEAFHSEADNSWALVRHEGALSIVVPHFARTTSPETFFKTAKTFRLATTNAWKEIKYADLNVTISVVTE